jgi:hypothetical protein
MSAGTGRPTRGKLKKTGRRIRAPRFDGGAGFRRIVLETAANFQEKGNRYSMAFMFERFAETIDGIPAGAVLGLLQREHRTIEDALQYKRINETYEVSSILCFCQFVNLVRGEEGGFPAVSSASLPVRHIAFYRKTVLRLIEAGELPESAKAQFDAMFSADFLRNLANN